MLLWYTTLNMYVSSGEVDSNGKPQQTSEHAEE